MTATCRDCGSVKALTDFPRDARCRAGYCQPCKACKRTKPLNVEAFWKRVQKTEGCWLWTASVKGPECPYGTFSAGGTRAVHRISYELAFGAIPAGMFVLHDCDTPLCVRPDHLFLGTQQDNMRDMIRKGRQQHGEWHSFAILT